MIYLEFPLQLESNQLTFDPDMGPIGSTRNNNSSTRMLCRAAILNKDKAKRLNLTETERDKTDRDPLRLVHAEVGPIGTATHAKLPIEKGFHNSRAAEANFSAEFTLDGLRWAINLHVAL